jgi:hypothetical protein
MIYVSIFSSSFDHRLHHSQAFADEVVVVVVITGFMGPPSAPHFILSKYLARANGKLLITFALHKHNVPVQPLMTLLANAFCQTIILTVFNHMMDAFLGWIQLTGRIRVRIGNLPP